MTRNSRGDEYSGGGLESDYPPPPLPSSSAYTAPYLRHVAKAPKPRMSPTVRGLAEKANDAFYARMGEGADKDQFYFDGFVAAFSEALVNECAAVLANDPRFSLCNGVMVSAGAVLKEHFGVQNGTT